MKEGRKDGGRKEKREEGRKGMKVHESEKTDYSPHKTEQSLLLRTPLPKIREATMIACRMAFMSRGQCLHRGVEAFAISAKTFL